MEEISLLLLCPFVYVLERQMNVPHKKFTLAYVKISLFHAWCKIKHSNFEEWLKKIQIKPQSFKRENGGDPHSRKRLDRMSKVKIQLPILHFEIEYISWISATYAKNYWFDRKQLFSIWANLIIIIGNHLTSAFFINERPSLSRWDIKSRIKKLQLLKLSRCVKASIIEAFSLR